MTKGLDESHGDYRYKENSVLVGMEYHGSSLSHHVVYLLIVIGTPIPETSVTVI